MMPSSGTESTKPNGGKVPLYLAPPEMKIRGTQLNNFDIL